jgi:hypothetical protein
MSELAPRFLDVKQSANHVTLSVRSIRNLLASGKLTALRPVKGKILVDRLELENLVASSTARPRTGRGLGR